MWVLVVTKKGTEGFLLEGSHQSIESAILEVYPTNSQLSNHNLMAIYGKSKCETAKHKNSETGSSGIMVGRISGILFNGPVK